MIRPRIVGVPPLASLKFGAANSDRVACGNIATNPMTFTIFAWVYPTSLSNDLMICGKTAAASVGKLYFSAQIAAGKGTYLQVDCATTDADARANEPLILNEWNCVAATCGDAILPRLYLGGLTTPLVECTYTVQTASAGARTSDSSASFTIGNRTTATNLAFVGNIGLFSFFNLHIFSLTELRRLQEYPYDWPAQPTLFSVLGRNLNGTVHDESGNRNHGTITGATVSPPVLMPAFRSRQHLPYRWSLGADLVTSSPWHYYALQRGQAA